MRVSGGVAKPKRDDRDHDWRARRLFAKVKPSFEAISPNVFHAGDIGAGHSGS